MLVIVIIITSLSSVIVIFAVSSDGFRTLHPPPMYLTSQPESQCPFVILQAHRTLDAPQL